MGLKRNEIYLGDCLEIMKDIDDKSIDLTVTSPPYDNLRDYNGNSAFNFKGIAKELYRITKDGGVVVWVVADATIKGSETGTSFKQALYFKEIGFNLHDTMIWNKTKMPQNHNRYEQGFEYMFIFSKGKLMSFNGIKDKVNLRAGDVAYCSYRDADGIVKKTSSYKKSKVADLGLRTNVWTHNPCMGGNNRNDHPAPFPIQLIEDHIISWSNENDIVLDCFLGSGTTAIASLNTGRFFIGIEKDEGYYNIAKKRIADHET